MAADGSRRAPGELEAEILAALWASTVPRTPAEIHAELADDLAYKTVHTILSRLAKKGRVRRVTHAGRPAYAAVDDAARDAAQRMRRTLESSQDRRSVLQNFVEVLSAADERELRELLAQEPPE
ncbi:BlaI/MecI/CopY family transcriptional regulator [Hamadaea tsunoensis]|uniref:BlaI/MecI/CopY family transcriptional regulator n=1 Tax=Hamadaea tsunoensis TaxID=53368 RepID=UPI0004237B30|nr:BlaI/MecI/CopY family transcriptional regulator [Hamadaea tsunoensis]